ncbi:MAG: low molecular weight phosphatase family protein [Clostridia bacterium]|nr:low molecular weight phosphatase family protein [Clostridia bacterium]
MLLFVCTGNTCRSPMAAALCRSRGIDAQSAGLSADSGNPATDQAVRAAHRHGADLSGHLSRPVTRSLIHDADQILVMTPAHAIALQTRFPEAAHRVRVLQPAIPDPFGGDDAVYEDCILHILEALKNAGVIP